MKRFKSLDGIRGLSILLVVFGHSYNSFISGGLASFLDKYYIHHSVGVSLFFVLSGYLITKLLIIEENEKGRVCLKKFYYKRLIRIFPAYYFYILCIFLFNYLYQYGISDESFIGALLYSGWYYPVDNDLEFFGHFWSLSIEEHFYFIFPILFIMVKKHRVNLIFALILMAPVIRVLNYYFLPLYKAKMGYLTHTRYDMILWGCLLASIESKRFINIIQNYFSSKYKYFIPFVALFLINPYLKVLLGAKYKYLVAYTLDGAFISLIILLIMNNKIQYNKIFENVILVKIGIYSYSIYIWQQVFTFKVGAPWNILFVVIVSVASFHLVEKNFMKLRKYIK